MTDSEQFLFFSLAYTVIELIGIGTAVSAIMNTRTPQGAIAWVFPLILFPMVALPMYWIFGRNRFSGYIVSRRRGSEKVQQQVAEGLSWFSGAYGSSFHDDRDRFRALERLAQLPFTSGNRLEVLIDGEATFAAIFEAIESAKSYLLVQFYILRDDDLGTRLQQALIAKARTGVRVFLLYDEVGSHELPRSYEETLRREGVDIRSFRTARGWTNRFQVNFRNHRKIVIADGKAAYVGGLNVGDEYLGKNPQFGHWRDTHLKIQGPAVVCVQLSYCEDWHWSSGQTLVDLNWDPKRIDTPGEDVLILPTGPADELESCGLLFTHLIHSARRRCWIASPYFVPGRAVVSALQLAALRGVDVRILLPAKPDHKLVHLCSFSYIEDIAASGVKFFRYEPGFLHQKVILVDDDFAAVGTANLDNRSFRLNFEITAAVAGADFASNVERMLEVDFSRSRDVSHDKLSDRPFLVRLASKTARLFAPIL